MIKLLLAATLAIGLGLAPGAFTPTAVAQTVDGKGQCRNPAGKVTDMKYCAIMGQPVVTRCRDPKARIDKCGAPKAEKPR